MNKTERATLESILDDLNKGDTGKAATSLAVLLDSADAKPAKPKAPRHWSRDLTAIKMSDGIVTQINWGLRRKENFKHPLRGFAGTSTAARSLGNMSRMPARPDWRRHMASLGFDLHGDVRP